MNWIKKNYDRFALLLLAVVLIVSSALIISRSREFPSIFEEVSQKVTPRSILPNTETKILENATAAIDEPLSWKASYSGSLFVSRKYIIRNGQPQDPLDGSSPMLHPPVPNDWLIKNNFDILEPNILNEDPDGDGFTILDEFVAGTDPHDKASRPVYTTKLRLKQFIRRPFRLKFAAYDGADFQINTLDLRQPSQFLKVGDAIAGTKFEIVKFEKKSAVNPNTDATEDVSELTLKSTEEDKEVVLVLDKVVDSPDSFALFKFLWNGDEYRVKKDQEFTLKPEPTVKYKLVDINDKEAVITNLTTNEQIKIPHLDAAAR